MLVFCSLMLLSVATVLTTSVYVFHRYEKELYRDTSLVLNMSVDSIEQKLSAVDTASSYVLMGNAVQDILQKRGVGFFHQGAGLFIRTSLSGIERSAFELLWSAFLRTFGGGLCQWKSFGIGDAYAMENTLVEELAMEVPGSVANRCFMRAKAGFLCAQHCEHERSI